jgi:hypothetical protein
MSLGVRRLRSVNPESIRGWCSRTITKRLSFRLRELIFWPYAEAHCTQQNAQIGGQTLQNHRTWEGFESAFFAAPFVVLKKRKTQAPARESSARG